MGRITWNTTREKKTRNALRKLHLCNVRDSCRITVSRTSLSAKPEADMKSNDTVTDGSSEGLTIGKRASSRQERERERERRIKREEIRMLIIFIRFLLAWTIVKFCEIVC